MAKKAKTTGEQDQGSKVFDHFRSVGLIADEVPFALLARGSASFVTTSIGRAFHIYDVKIDLLSSLNFFLCLDGEPWTSVCE